MFKRKLVVLSTVFILGGCVSLEPDYQRPDLPTPQLFSLSGNTLVNQIGSPTSGWSVFFTDPQLKKIISTALQSNRDLQTAILKVEEAAEQYNVTKADRYPQINGSTGISYSGGLINETSTTHQYNVGINVSYELDFFGKLKNMSEADRQYFMASQQAQRAAHIVVVSQVAQNYLNNLLIRQQLDISKRSLQNYQQSFQFIEQRNGVGQSTLLDLEQARGLVETTKSDIAKRQGELAQSSSALQLVVGQYNLLPLSPLPVDKYELDVKLPENLSSNILLQRPDIAEAEHQLIAANANIGVARAAFFPSISLTGDLTSSNTDLSRLFNASSGVWNFIPKIELPIFNGGKNKSNLSLAEIRKNMSIVNYEQKIQTAFKEVSDALSLKNSLQQQFIAQKRYLNSLRITSQRANLLYINGAVSFLDVLDAERSLFSAQQDLAELKYTLQLNEINLFVALGGGWIE